MQIIRKVIIKLIIIFASYAEGAGFVRVCVCVCVSVLRKSYVNLLSVLLLLLLLSQLLCGVWRSELIPREGRSSWRSVLEVLNRTYSSHTYRTHRIHIAYTSHAHRMYSSHCTLIAVLFGCSSAARGFLLILQWINLIIANLALPVFPVASGDISPNHCLGNSKVT